VPPSTVAQVILERIWAFQAALDRKDPNPNSNTVVSEPTPVSSVYKQRVAICQGYNQANGQTRESRSVNLKPKETRQRVRAYLP
jgi:hypothetical protein